jgi:carboxyl-terminal processing protease
VKRSYAFLALSLALAVAVAAIASGALNDAMQGVYRLVGLVGQIVGLVETDYVEEVPLDRLETGAMVGLVEAADPGGAWVPGAKAAAYEQLHRRATPPFGLVLGKRSTYPMVIEVMPGSAAARAELVPGELLERVADQPVRARPLWMSELLLDEAERAGKPITLDVINRDLTGKEQITLTPVAVPAPLPAVEVRDGIPVVRLASVDDASLIAIRQVLAQQGRAQSIVVDLTGTGLGTPRDAAALAAELAGGEVSLTWTTRDKHEGTLRAKAPERTWHVFVCIDATTAHAAELLALGLRQRGATLVGRETFGDTGEREAVHQDGGQLWLARRWFTTADGSPLLGEGLKPAEPVRGRVWGEGIVERALELARAKDAPKAAA